MPGFSELVKDSGLSKLTSEELGHRVWNCDETGFCTSVAARSVLAKRGAKEVHDTVGGSGREYITVLGAGCADGTRLPPYVVYKGKNLYKVGQLVMSSQFLTVDGWKL